MEVIKKMPGGDRTAPEGYGSRTGRGLGYCSGYDSPGFPKGAPRGGGFGRGWGRGFGRGYWRRGREFWRIDNYPDPYNRPAPYYRDVLLKPSKDEVKSYLENVVKSLEGELKAMKVRLQELSKEKKEIE